MSWGRYNLDDRRPCSGRWTEGKSSLWNSTCFWSTRIDQDLGLYLLSPYAVSHWDAMRVFALAMHGMVSPSSRRRAGSDYQVSPPESAWARCSRPSSPSSPALWQCSTSLTARIEYASRSAARLSERPICPSLVSGPQFLEIYHTVDRVVAWRCRGCGSRSSLCRWSYFTILVHALTDTFGS